MRTDFTTLREDLARLTTGMQELMGGLFQTLNGQRRQMLAIYQAMHDTTEDIAEFANIISDTADTLTAVSELSIETAEKSAEVVSFMEEVPTCDFEKFVDFCDQCGGSISEDSDYSVTDSGWTICADCAHAEEIGLPVDEDETTVEETETVELAETVAPAIEA